MNKLKDFKNCEKGHFYPKDKDVCPYCPKGSDDKTDSTKLISDQIEKISPSVSSTNSEDVNKTIVFGESDEKKPTKKTAKFDPNKTIISGTDISRNDDDVNSSSNKIVRRKFRGWLVTFDLKDMEYGVDFKIEEGRNTIGKSSSSDITIDDKK